MTSRLPVLFVSHGSPDLLLRSDPLEHAWWAQVADLPTPRGIVMVSAHWETPAFTVSGNQHQQTTHDFYGFPEALYDYQYPAPEAVALADSLSQSLGLATEHERGLDHGAWVPLQVMYPKADIPVVQISVSSAMGAAAHLRLGQALAALREQGILIVASGVIVHNLRKLDWRSYAQAQPESWATQFMQAFASHAQQRDWEALLNPTALPYGQVAVPTLEHYLPFLVAAGAADADDALTPFASEWRFGNLSMHSWRFG